MKNKTTYSDTYWRAVVRSYFIDPDIEFELIKVSSDLIRWKEYLESGDYFINTQRPPEAIERQSAANVRRRRNDSGL